MSRKPSTSTSVLCGAISHSLNQDITTSLQTPGAVVTPSTTGAGAEG